MNITVIGGYENAEDDDTERGMNNDKNLEKETDTSIWRYFTSLDKWRGNYSEHENIDDHEADASTKEKVTDKEL